MTRADHVSGTDRIAEVVGRLPCRAVVNVQGDEPLIEPETIDAAIAPLLADALGRDEHVSAGRSAASRRIQEPSRRQSRHQSSGRCAVFFARPNTGFRPSALRLLRGSLARSAAVARAHVGLYVYRRETLLKLAAAPAVPLELEESLEQLRALALGIRIRVVETRHVAAGVDTPEDLERVRQMMMASSRT